MKHNWDFEEINKELKPNAVFKMIEVYLFMKNPRYKGKGFKSRNHIGRVMDNTTNVEISTRDVLSKMLELNLIIIREDNLVHLDFDAFEEFIENTELGKKMFSYVDEISTIRL